MENELVLSAFLYLSHIGRISESDQSVFYVHKVCFFIPVVRQVITFYELFSWNDLIMEFIKQVSST